MTLFNKVITAGFAGFAGLIIISSPLAAAPAGQAGRAVAAVDDDAIESQIEAVFEKNSTLAPRDLDVESEHGAVTLTGTVRTAAEKATAGRLANVPGVTRVVNNVEVDPNIDRSKIDTAGEKTKAGLSKAVDATAKAAKKSKEGVQKGVGKAEQGVGKGAEKTSDAIGTAGEKLSDASVTTSVKGKLSEDGLLRESSIDVDTADHVVTLKGTVASEAAKARAAAIAAGTSGVTRVVNQLVVRGA